MISISVSVVETQPEDMGPIKLSTLREAAKRGADKFHEDLKEAISGSSKHLDDLEFLITDAEYGDAASFVGSNEKFNPKLAKLVIELNGLSEIGPKDIVDRKEQEVLDLIEKERA